MKSKILLIGLIALTLICCGCVEEEISESTLTPEQYVIDDCIKHQNTFLEDITKVDAIVERWSTAYDMAVADNHITNEEINQLVNIADEYAYEYKRMKPHLISYKEFMIENEFELKNADLDTYEVKKALDDVDSLYALNCEGMISDLEYLRTCAETSEQEEDIEGTIEDLLNIAAIFI